MEDVVERLTNTLREAAALIEKLRCQRYRKWTQDDVIVDVLATSGQPMTKWQITQEMKRGGWEFGALTMEPEKSVGSRLSNLSSVGRVVKVSDGHGGDWSVDATWTVPSPARERVPDPEL